ncbi:MAG: winged helix-turn-helix transcriptional regulator [Anaerolineales bacterium]
MADIERHEYEVLNEIARDSLVTQATLSRRLGMAVGSVNWYIKRLISRGWVKVSHLNRTRLQYDLTPEGMAVFTQRALQYAKDSLRVYQSFRQQARAVVARLKAEGISRVRFEGDDEIMDILRLTCIEAGLSLEASGEAVVLRHEQDGYQVIYPAAVGEALSSQNDQEDGAVSNTGTVFR